MDFIECCKFMLVTMVCVYYVYRLIVYIWLKWFSGTIYQYFDVGKGGEHIPVTFQYKGNDIKLCVKSETTENNPVSLYQRLTTHIVYINDNMVMSLSEFIGSRLLLTKRWVDMNNKYDTKDVFKILRKFRKQKFKESLSQYKEHKKESIY